MPRVCIVFFLTIISVTAFAQQKERDFQSIPDSVMQRFREKTKAGISGLDSAAQKSQSRIDSQKTVLSGYQHTLDSVKGKLAHRIDSLKNLNLSTEQYSKLLDSLNAGGPLNDAKEAKAKLVVLQNSMKGTQNKIIQAGTNAGVNIPGVKMPDIHLPGAGVKLNANQYHVPRMTLPQTNLEGIDPKLNMNSTFNGFKLPEPKIELPGMNINNSFSGFRDASGKLKSYSAEIKNIKAGNLTGMEKLSRAAEQKALESEGLKHLQQNQAQFGQVQSQLAKLNDGSGVKAMAKQELAKQAVDHFADKEAVLQQAMVKMSSLKMKYSELASLSDTLKRRPNPLRARPLIERIVPGFTMQFLNNRSSQFVMDVNPSVAYKLSERLSAGTGWVERLYVQDWKLRHSNPVYGIRSFGEFRMGSRFIFRADIEYMNALVPQPVYGAGATDTSRRLWQWNVITGVKTDFTVYKKIRGNVQTLYRIWSNYDQTIYADRFIVRMGFEFPMKKK